MYDFSFPEIKIPEMTELADMPAKFMWSDTQFEIIKKHITDFENKLDQKHGRWVVQSEEDINE